MARRNGGEIALLNTLFRAFPFRNRLLEVGKVIFFAPAALEPSSIRFLPRFALICPPLHFGGSGPDYSGRGQIWWYLVIGFKNAANSSSVSFCTSRLNPDIAWATLDTLDEANANLEVT